MLTLPHHHALLVRGEHAEIVPQLEEALGVAFTKAAHPDIIFIRTETFGIDEVRALTIASGRVPLEREEILAIILPQTITVEAQNALLKLTEDPPPSARFIFVLPETFPILPTLNSRLFLVPHTVPPTYEVAQHTSFGSTIGEKLEFIAKSVKNEDTTALLTLLNELEVSARTHKDATLLRAVLTARRYQSARGASPKMLLEHAVLTRAEIE